MNQIEKIRNQWKRGELSLGTAVALTDAAVSELFGEAGYDFVWIDCEHSALSLSQALDHIRAARGAGAAAFVRVPSNDPVVMKPYLELHPAAVIVPRIESLQDAERAVAGFHYPPRGSRGFGPARGVRFGAVAPPQYLAEIDRNMMLVLQIEHIRAVDQIDAILELPGVDSIVAGPGDLSASMGLGGQAGHADVTAACEKIYRAAIRKGIPAGHSTGYDPQGIRRWLALGLSWIAVDGDWITLYRHASEVARRIREIQPASSS